MSNLFSSIQTLKQMCARKGYILLALLFLSPYCIAQRHIKVSTTQQLFDAIDNARETEGSDTIFIDIASGTYLLDRPILLTEEDTHPIVFEGDGPTKPIISAGRRIEGWKLTPEGWWTCHVPETAHYGWRFEQLYINGKRATRARTPDEGFFTVKTSEEDVHYHGGGRAPLYGTQKIEVTPNDLEQLKDLSQIDVERIVARFYHKWDNTSKYLQFALPDSGYIFFTGRGMKPWNIVGKGSRYYLENYRKALNAPGEWLLEDDGTLTYIPRNGEDILTAECFAPMLTQAVILKGTHNKPITHKIFRRISFAHTANYMPRSGHDSEQVAASIDAAIMMDHANNITIDDCEVQHTGNYAIWLRSECHDNKITHTFIHDIGGGGIKIGKTTLPGRDEQVTSNTLVENNILRHLGMTFPCSGGVIIFHAAHNRILHNEICDFRYTGVSVGWIWGYSFSPSVDNEVGFNHIHHIGWGELSDMGAVYTLGTSSGTRIHDNLIHDVWSYDYGGWGLYTDEGSTGIIMENNLVYNTKCGGFHQHYGRENIIRNNIFAWGWLQQLEFSRPEKHQSFSFEHNIVLMKRGEMLAGRWTDGMIAMNNNCYYDINGTAPTFMQQDLTSWKRLHDQKSIIAHPGFRDAEHYDFHFNSQKVAKKIGFKPFDYTQAGVYGNDEWKAKAQMEQKELDAFSRLFK